MAPLWDGLSSAYEALGFARAASRDGVFRQLVLARIIEPTSKLDSLRVLTEAGVGTVSHPTLNRRPHDYADAGFRPQARRGVRGARPAGAAVESPGEGGSSAGPRVGPIVRGGGVFSPEDKHAVVEEYNRLTEPGAKGALLRR